MRGLAWALALALAAISAACGKPGGLTTRLAPTGSDVPALMKPAEAYAVVARLVRSCWLNATPPLVPGHEFNAAANPGQGARIDLVEKTPTGYLRSYSIGFAASLGGTEITTQNQRFSEQLAQRLNADVARWSRGELTCGPGA